MADDLEALLKKSPLTDSQRADAWDAFKNAKDQNDLSPTLNAMSIPKEVKANLWDLKARDTGSQFSANLAASAPAAALDRPGFVARAAQAAGVPTSLDALVQSSPLGGVVNAYNAAKGGDASGVAEGVLQTLPLGGPGAANMLRSLRQASTGDVSGLVSQIPLSAQAQALGTDIGTGNLPGVAGTVAGTAALLLGGKAIDAGAANPTIRSGAGTALRYAPDVALAVATHGWSAPMSLIARIAHRAIRDAPDIIAARVRAAADTATPAAERAVETAPAAAPTAPEPPPAAAAPPAATTPAPAGKPVPQVVQQWPIPMTAERPDIVAAMARGATTEEIKSLVLNGPAPEAAAAQPAAAAPPTAQPAQAAATPPAGAGPSVVSAADAALRQLKDQRGYPSSQPVVVPEPTGASLEELRARMDALRARQAATPEPAPAAAPAAPVAAPAEPAITAPGGWREVGIQNWYGTKDLPTGEDWAQMGGQKMKRAWLESRNIIPGAGTVEDVAAAVAAGVPAEQIQALYGEQRLPAASRANPSSGQPSPASMAPVERTPLTSKQLQSSATGMAQELQDKVVRLRAMGLGPAAIADSIRTAYSLPPSTALKMTHMVLTSIPR